MLNKIIACSMDIKTVNDLLLKATKGKFKLYDREKFEQRVSDIKSLSNSFFSFFVGMEEDIYNVRHEVEKIIKNRFPNIDQKKLYNILLVFTELSTNMIKHACNGYFEIYLDHNDIYMLFKDSGAGISIDRIPYITLSNYSRLEDSLGFGFNICIELSDSIEMETSQDGTNIIVLMRI
ncbi:MAG: ATP-binding protein [Candidatus Calescibacterium sp.]|nr:ATP-binding protein [Candidatus Calescibacterium sp.]MDW8132102.1 ATP-binding protein [Candidatus Calescibacterium sp.]